MEQPTVVRMRRNKLGIIQDCDLYIGRACRLGGWNLAASKWANPFYVDSPECKGSVEIAVAKYEQYLRQERPDLIAVIVPELAGKKLGCWCKPGPCHGDVLVRLFIEQQTQKREHDSNTS